MSRENLGGEREAALKRDNHQCQICGELNLDQIILHHRRPGVEDRRYYITLCRACHVRIHGTWRPTWAFLSFGFLRRLWREANGDLAEQHLLELLREKSEAEQRELFAWQAFWNSLGPFERFLFMRIVLSHLSQNKDVHLSVMPSKMMVRKKTEEAIQKPPEPAEENLGGMHDLLTYLSYVRAGT